MWKASETSQLGITIQVSQPAPDWRWYLTGRRGFKVAVCGTEAMLKSMVQRDFGQHGLRRPWTWSGSRQRAVGFIPAESRSPPRGSRISRLAVSAARYDAGSSKQLGSKRRLNAIPPG